MPVTVVPTSSATVAMETFITELSSVIRNCPDASVSRTALDAPAATATAARSSPMAAIRAHGVPWWSGPASIR